MNQDTRIRVKMNRATLMLGLTTAFGMAAVHIGCSATTPSSGSLPKATRHHAVEHTSSFGMVSTGSQEATDAAIEVLEQGGNAVDAAVVASFVLGVSDLADSGLGGSVFVVGSFADGRSTCIDGSSLVPSRINRSRIRRIERENLQRGIDLTAIPGYLRAIETLIERYATLSLPQLIQPAIDVAENGYLPTLFQHATASKYKEQILASEHFKFIALHDGVDLHPLGSPVARPQLRATLGRIAEFGVDDFYSGEIAKAIASDMRQRGGPITEEDLARLRIHEVRPLSTTYRGLEVLTVPPPAMGAAVVQGLKMLETFPSTILAEHSVPRMQRFAEVYRIMLEDHPRFLWAGGSSARGQRLSDSIAKRALERARRITIGPSEPVASTPDRDRDTNTTQVSVIDRWGNAVSLTQSIGRYYGCKVSTKDLGFPYNSHLEGIEPLPPGSPVPTTIAPTIVLKKGKPRLVLGSGGSSRVPSAIASVISYTFDAGLPLSEAVTYPRVLWQRAGTTNRAMLEVLEPVTAADLEEFLALGYSDVLVADNAADIATVSRLGGVNAVAQDPETGILIGVGDPRRQGTSRGAER